MTGGPAARLPQYSSLGQRFQVRCDDAELSGRLEDLYSSCRCRDDGCADVDLEITFCETSGSFDLRAGGELACAGVSRDDVLAWCAWLINNLAAERSRHLVLHAAAATRDGRVVILAGPSGSGKSTLVSALVRAGMSYLGDDSLAVDDGGTRIRSNPKPIALDGDSRRALTLTAVGHHSTQTGKALVAPTSVGTVFDAESTWAPALIVQPRFRPGEDTAVAPLAPAEAAELLADQSFNFASAGAAGLRTVATLGRSCAAFVVEYGDLAAAVDMISQALDAHVPSVAERTSPLETHVPAPPGLDVEMLGAEALIWHRGARELHRLSPAATAIWQAAEGASDAAAIAASLDILVPGTSGAARNSVLDDVEACIDTLAARGLLSADAAERLSGARTRYCSGATTESDDDPGAPAGTTPARR